MHPCQAEGSSHHFRSRLHYAGEIWKLNNHRTFWILFCGKPGQINMMPSFSTNNYYKVWAISIQQNIPKFANGNTWYGDLLETFSDNPGDGWISQSRTIHSKILEISRENSCEKFPKFWYTSEIATPFVTGNFGKFKLQLVTVDKTCKINHIHRIIESVTGIDITCCPPE